MHTITIRGSETEYQFTIDGETLTKNADAGSIQPNDEIDGQTATGGVWGGTDAYDFDGSITAFSWSGATPTVHIDGTAVPAGDVVEATGGDTETGGDKDTGGDPRRVPGQVDVYPAGDVFVAVDEENARLKRSRDAGVVLDRACAAARRGSRVEVHGGRYLMTSTADIGGDYRCLDFTGARFVQAAGTDLDMMLDAARNPRGDLVIHGGEFDQQAAKQSGGEAVVRFRANFDDWVWYGPVLEDPYRRGFWLDGVYDFSIRDPEIDYSAYGAGRPDGSAGLDEAIAAYHIDDKNGIVSNGTIAGGQALGGQDNFSHDEHFADYGILMEAGGGMTIDTKCQDFTEDGILVRGGRVPKIKLSAEFCRTGIHIKTRNQKLFGGTLESSKFNDCKRSIWIENGGCKQVRDLTVMPMRGTDSGGVIEAGQAADGEGPVEDIRVLASEVRIDESDATAREAGIREL